MSITLQSWVDRAVEMALVGIDNPDSSYVQTAEMLAETLIPQVAQAVARDAAGDPQGFQQVLYTHELSFSNGTATIPDVVLTEFMPQSNWDDPDDNTVVSVTSWVRTYYDFRNNPDNRLGYFCENPAGTLVYQPYGTTYDPNGGSNFGGTINWTVPSSPVIPTSPNTVIDVTGEIEDQLVTSLSSAIKAQEAWQALSTRTMPEPN